MKTKIKVDTGVLMFAVIITFLLIFIIVGILYVIGHIKSSDENTKRHLEDNDRINRIVANNERYARKVLEAVYLKKDQIEGIEIDGKKCPSTAALKGLIENAKTPEGKSLYERASSLHEEMHRKTIDINEKLQKHDYNVTNEYDEFIKHFREFRDQSLAKAQSLISKDLSDGVLDNDKFISSFKEYWMIFGIAMIVFVAVFAYFVVVTLRRFVINLNIFSKNISNVTKEVSAGNQDLSGRTQEQASSLEETASTLEEITSTVKQTTSNSQKAAQFLTRSVGITDEGLIVSEQTSNAMSEISNSSGKIAEIVGLVEDISFQTNILAINAAIEAAKAGDQGKGFAVVAIEVRDLAQRAAEATKEIKVLIDISVEKVAKGENLVKFNNEKLKEISSGIKQVSDIVSEISVATKEQFTAIEQINTAVSQLDSVTQQNASLVEKIASSSEDMSTKTEGMYKLIESHFSVNA